MVSLGAYEAVFFEDGERLCLKFNYIVVGYHQDMIATIVSSGISYHCAICRHHSCIGLSVAFLTWQFR